MRERRKGLPESEDSVEGNDSSQSDRIWVRKRWRKPRGKPVTRCAKCGTHLNRKDTYYVRPAYTDGEVWICSGCYDRMSRDTDDEPDHRYGRRRHDE